MSPEKIRRALRPGHVELAPVDLTEPWALVDRFDVVPAIDISPPPVVVCETRPTHWV